jgi:hypothetical protein
LSGSIGVCCLSLSEDFDSVSVIITDSDVIVDDSRFVNLLFSSVTEIAVLVELNRKKNTKLEIIS